MKINSNYLKKLTAFIIMVFSISVTDAQCICVCGAQPKNHAECFTKSNGTVGCRNTNCRYRIANATSTSDVISLEDISPNPASTSTTISFYVGQTENLSLKIFDVSGRLIKTLADAFYDEGEYEIIWNTEDIKSGIYFLKLQSAEYLQMDKLIVSK
jgi:hypothetical protein